MESHRAAEDSPGLPRRRGPGLAGLAVGASVVGGDWHVLGAESFEPTVIRLPRGATLALYTDGLVESRTRPIGDRLAARRSALSSALAGAGPLSEAADRVTRRLRQHGEDDITLVLARIRPAAAAAAGTALRRRRNRYR